MAYDNVLLNFTKILFICICTFISCFTFVLLCALLL